MASAYVLPCGCDIGQACAVSEYWPPAHKSKTLEWQEPSDCCSVLSCTVNTVGQISSSQTANEARVYSPAPSFMQVSQNSFWSETAQTFRLDRHLSFKSWASCHHGLRPSAFWCVWKVCLLRLSAHNNGKPLTGMSAVSMTRPKHGNYDSHLS